MLTRKTGAMTIQSPTSNNLPETEMMNNSSCRPCHEKTSGPFRFSISRTVAVIGALLFAVAPVLAQAEKPNLIYILLDDAGVNDLSCYGQKKFETPNIDALASGGMKFTQHYSGSTVCAPTRSVLMTGLHTGHTFVRGNRSMKPEGQLPLPEGTETIASVLRDAGYTCGAFGKWGLGPPGSHGDPVHQGFDQFYGYNCQAEAHSYYPDHLWDNLQRVELDGKTYSHDLIMDQAFSFIRENKDRPFFCFLPVTIPHAAMHVPESYSQPFRKKFSQFEDKIGKYRGPTVENPIAAFAGMMTKLDEDVGRLMELLKELGLDENTVVFLSSDNGPHKEGGHDPVFFDSNGPFRGFKRDLYEGGIRAPLIVRWPNKIEPGTTSYLVSAHWDMMPTFCELAGVDSPKPCDGISIVPTLLSNGDQKGHDYLYWEFYEQGGKRAARFDGHWKAVQRNLNKEADPPIEIYSLGCDQGETTDIAAQNPHKVERARQIFKDAHTPSKIWQFKIPANR